MEKINAIITGIGGYVPDYILTNQELSRMVDTTDEWIQTRVGIKERRILTEEGLGTSYMARKAASQLLEKTGADPDSIDALIVATTTPDYKFPSTASIVVGRLGMHNAFAMDTAAACSGFLYTLDLACSMIESGRYKRIIVIGADKMSSMVDYTDRNTCVLFGDGAGAVLVEGTTEEGVGMQGSYLRTDGKGLPFLHLKAGGSVCPPVTVHGVAQAPLYLSGGAHGLPLCRHGDEQRRWDDDEPIRTDSRDHQLGDTPRGQPPHHRGRGQARGDTAR